MRAARLRVVEPLMLRAPPITALAICAAASAGCSSVPDLIVGTLPTAPVTQTARGPTLHDEPPAELYVRIARGANSCWFGRDGTLKATHLFHADVEPSHKGAGAEIIIFERDQNALSGNPRALRALRIVISRSGSRSEVDAQPLRIPADVGSQLVDDVHRWAGGDNSCVSPAPAGALAPVTAGKGSSTPAATPAK